MINRTGKEIVYIDMDNVICDYRSSYIKSMKESPDMIYPQSQYGFFMELAPMEGAISSILELDSMGYDIYFATAPSYMNPMCLAEKNYWIRNHFGMEWCKKLIIISNKSLLLGDYLIDDNKSTHKQDEFTGELLHFGNIDWKYGDLRTWDKVLKFFKNRKDENIIS